MKHYDVAVIGGGLLGSAFAYGLSAQGVRVVLLDEGDNAIRTARGNFGLVWVQGKGQGMPQYALWSRRSAYAWTPFSEQLIEETGTDPGYHRPGGFCVALDEAEFNSNLKLMEQLREEAGEHGYAYEVVDRAALGQYLPEVGPTVPGATYCPHDGHANPLRLLRALQEGFNHNGGIYVPRARVSEIRPLSTGGFEILSDAEHQVGCEKLVIAAGHGSVDLGRMLGMEVPIFPVQGQVVVTERAPAAMIYPTNYVRQTDEGNFLLGPSARDVGFNDDTQTATLQGITRQCTRAFPHLKNLRIQRTWAALRIMTPDGFPVYQQSDVYPDAFSFSCHSGVTLAAVHAVEVPRWVLSGGIPSEYRCFHPERFDV